MSQVELACKEAVFHFNKHHLEDPKVPMWIIKAKGESWYVEHVICSVPWSTKETPNNSHTKGSIKLKNCLITIDDDNVATITELTLEDKLRLVKREAIRIITSSGSQLKNILLTKNIKHSNIQVFGGGCSTVWYVCDILEPSHYTMLSLMLPNVRQLMANEDYYKWYDDPDNDEDGYEVDLYDDEEWYDN